MRWSPARPIPPTMVSILLGCLAASAIAPAAAAGPSPSVLPILPPESLYAAGGPVPAGPAGQVLAQVELRAPEGARKWAVIYRSTSFDGSPIGVSGLIVAPSTPLAPGEPPRTVLSIAHATTGLADTCAPSRTPSDGLVTSALPLLEEGFVLAVTDYEGLGTPGPHPYIVGRSEGQSVLDAAIAAAAMGDLGADTYTGAGTRTLLVGGSQGGHAVLWAADMAATAAPSLDVLGAVAFAPAGDLEAIARSWQAQGAGPDAWSSIVRLVGAWHQVYDLPLDVLTPEGQTLVARLDTACDIQVDAAPTTVDLESRPEWQARLLANTPAATHTDVPVLIFQGDADRVVPTESTRSLVARMCEMGDTVDLRVLPGADHPGSLNASSLLATLGWVGDRLAGTPAASTCDQAGRLSP